MSSDVWITLCKCSVKCLNEMQCFKGDALDTHSVSGVYRFVELWKFIITIYCVINAMNEMSIFKVLALGPNSGSRPSKVVPPLL